MIVIVGDTHGNLGFVKKLKMMYPGLTKIIQLGDFGYWPEEHSIKKQLEEISNGSIPVDFIDGNHENHLKLKEFTQNGVLRHIKRGIVERLIINEEEQNCLFIGGAESIDKNERTPGFDWFVEETIDYKDFDRAIENIEKLGKLDVVFSHTCPIEFKYSVCQYNLGRDPSCEALSIILKKYKPKLWFFGHFHFYFNGYYSDTGTRFIALDKVDSDLDLTSKNHYVV